ncbi:MAG: sulfatase-like hydrolase/transferase [Kiritimatiellae bacterium]|nr:sulfatase-like hydrolase/transferase [Kiritimatiellia bacterium]
MRLRPRHLASVAARIAFAAFAVWCVLVEIAEFAAGRLFGMVLDGDWFLLLVGSSRAAMGEFLRIYGLPLAAAAAAILVLAAAIVVVSLRASRRVFLAVVAVAAAAVAVRVAQVGSARAWKPVYVAFDTLRSARSYAGIAAAGRWTDARAAQARSLPEGATNYVVVIGESMTTHRLSFFGYGKHTTPGLERLGSALSVQGPVRAPSPYTVTALARLLIDDGAAAPVWFRLAGYRTAFVGAHHRWARYCSVEASIFEACEPKLYLSELMKGEHIYDEYLLPHVRELMGRKGPFALFVHMMGSHFSQVDRVPAGFAADEGLDDYDRSIRYSDMVLSEIIAALPPRTVLLYISDHGESTDTGRWRDVASEALWSVPVFVYPADAAPRIETVSDFVSAWRAWTR